MPNYFVIVCKPKHSMSFESLHQVFEKMPAAVAPLSELFDELSSGELIAEYSQKYSGSVRNDRTLTVKANYVHFEISCTEHLVRFEHLDGHRDSAPFWDLEEFAGRHGCVIYDPQTELVLRNLPGSLVNSVRETFVKGIDQIPLALTIGSSFKLDTYYGTVRETTQEIATRTGILFETWSENVDYAEVAYIEMSGMRFRLACYFRLEGSPVYIFSSSGDAEKNQVPALLTALDLDLQEA